MDRAGRGKASASRGGASGKGKDGKRPFLVGDRVCLRTLEPEDINETYVGWLNDPEVARFLQTGTAPATLASLRRYVSIRHSRPI